MIGDDRDKFGGTPSPRPHADDLHKRALDAEQAEKNRREAIRAINGLLKIAERAMPDTYFATDARVLFAKGTLRRLKGQP